MIDKFEEMDVIFREVEAGKPFPWLNPHQQAMFVKMLIEAGLNLDTTASSLLTETQLRDDLSKGRGPGLVAALGRDAEVEAFFRLCLESSEGGKRIISNKTGEPKEGSHGRGMRQLGADFVSLALAIVLADDEKISEITNRINKRLWRSWEIAQESDLPTERSIIVSRFEALGLEKPTAKTASVHNPGDNVWTIWLYLTGRLQ